MVPDLWFPLEATDSVRGWAKKKRGACAPLFEPSNGTPFHRYTKVHLVWGDRQRIGSIALSERPDGQQTRRLSSWLNCTGPSDFISLHRTLDAKASREIK